MSGGLDLAIERVFDAETVWVSDIEPGPCKVLAHRFPHAPNLGDITKIDWSTVEPVDIIAGGSPCQDISSAGRMAGMREGTRSNLWVEMREAIRVLQPLYVIWENVYNARSAPASSAMESDPRLLGDHPAGVPALRALGRVLGDLASLGFDAQWHSLRAADVGAPHGRMRYFVLARRRDASADARSELGQQRRIAAAREAAAGGALGELAGRDRAPVALLPTPTTRDTKGHNQRGDATCLTGALLPTPSVADSTGGHERRGGKRGDELLLKGIATRQAWGPYAAAIARWERIIGPAPAPTKWTPKYFKMRRRRASGHDPRPVGMRGSLRPVVKLNPEFASWMMGAAPGWITDVPGVTDNEALRMAGNGVVQRQAEVALRIMADRFAQWSTP